MVSKRQLNPGPSAHKEPQEDLGEEQQSRRKGQVHRHQPLRAEAGVARPGQATKGRE